MKMRAAVLLEKEHFEVKDIDKPRCGSGEVLVRVQACAICGSDLRIFHGEKRIDVPITGHEISGIIDEVGKDVEELLPGDKVIVETVIGCGECVPCRRAKENLCRKRFTAIGYQYNGGFAQFLVVPRRAVKQGCVIKIPEHLSFDEATIVEPLSCVINGWAPFQKRDPGFTTVVIGAGIIGMLHVEYAKAKGAKVILVNRSAPRLVLAQKIGLSAEEYVDESQTNSVKRVKELTNGLGAEVVVCAASSKETQRRALEMGAVNADVSFFAGISKDDPYAVLDTNLVHYGELHVHGANSSHKSQYLEALELVASGKINVKKFITHRFPLGRIGEAIRALEDRSSNAIKVIVDPWL